MRPAVFSLTLQEEPYRPIWMRRPFRKFSISIARGENAEKVLRPFVIFWSSFLIRYLWEEKRSSRHAISCVSIFSLVPVMLFTRLLSYSTDLKELSRQTEYSTESRA